MKTLDAKKDIDSNTRRIGVRDFVRNTKKYRKQLERGESFVLSSNGKEFAILKPIKSKEKKYSKQDLLDAIFGTITDIPGLSNEEIDDIAYGG